MKHEERSELKRIVNILFKVGINKLNTMDAIENFINRTYLMGDATLIQQAKIKQLENILMARLPIINRWRKVRVFTSGDSFIIEWSKPKNKNIHPIETKCVPLTDLDILIKRNSERLYNETKTYK